MSQCCARRRVDQWVASRGVDSSVAVNTRSTWASVFFRGTPGRGSSSIPSVVGATNRPRHLPTVCLITCRSRAIAVAVSPAAQQEPIVPATRELGQASDGASSVRACLVRQSSAQSAVPVGPVTSACRPCSRVRQSIETCFTDLTQRASGRVLRVSSCAQTGVLEGDRRPRC